MYFSPRDGDFWGFNYSFACLQTGRAIFRGRRAGTIAGLNTGAETAAPSSLIYLSDGECVAELRVCFQKGSWNVSCSIFCSFTSSNCSLCSGNRDFSPVIVFGEFSLTSDEVHLQNDWLSGSQQLKHRRLTSSFTEPSLYRLAAALRK